MASDTFVMSSRQSAELDYAFERNGWTAGDVKWLSEGKNLAAILGVRRGTDKIVPAPLLDFVDTFDVPPDSEPFAVAARFVVDTSDGAEVKISGLGPNLEAWFLPLVEPAFAGSALRIDGVARCANATQMAEAIGGDEEATTTMREVLAAMKSGKLRTNGWATVFPRVRDAQGVLRQVNVRWYGGGWYVNACEASNSIEWFDEYHVVSHNSR